MDGKIGRAIRIKAVFGTNNAPISLFGLSTPLQIPAENQVDVDVRDDYPQAEIVKRIQTNAASLLTKLGWNDIHLFNLKTGVVYKKDDPIPLDDGDMVEVKNAKDVVEMTFGIAGEGRKAEDFHTVLVDINDPLRKYIPLLQKMYNLKGKDEYCFRKLRMKAEKAELLHYLNANLPFRKQNLKNGNTVVLLPLGHLEDKFFQQLNDGDVSKSGWMSKNSQKGDSKATGMKKRYCILRDHFLIYLADSKDMTKPSGVVDVENMIVTRENNTLILKSCDYSFRSGGLVYHFVCETPNDAKDWFAEIRNHCFNGVFSRVFGISLVRLWKNFSSVYNPFDVILKCVNYIDAKAIKTESLFTVAGSAKVLEALKAEFDNGNEVNLNDAKWEDPFAIAGLLKAYFRELPTPLLGSDIDKFLAAKEDFEKLNALIQDLAVSHQVMFQIMIHFIGRVVSSKSKNKLDRDAMATVFGPIFLRRKEETQESILKDLGDVKMVMALLIDNRAKITFNPPVSGKKTFELELRNDPVQRVQALYDYQAQGKSNNKGELDMSFKKGEDLILVEERNNWWKCENAEGKVGLVPSNYVAKTASSGEVKIAVKEEKTKRPKGEKKNKLRKNDVGNTSVYDLPLPPPSLLNISQNLPPPPKEETFTFDELKQKYDEEKKLRMKLEEELAKANQTIKELKEKLGK